MNRWRHNAHCDAPEPDRPTLAVRAVGGARKHTPSFATPHWRSQRHAAFTILELVLALAVIAAVSALAWPFMLRFSADQTLRENVEAVRARAARTRLTAIESGLVYQFRFEPNGRRCVVLPFERPLEAGADSTATTAATQFPAYVLELKEGLQFLQGPPGPALLTAAPATVERLSEETLSAFGIPASLAQAAWAPAILFRPDGTAQDASVYVADAQGRYQIVSVRGLTASTSVSAVQREDRR